MEYREGTTMAELIEDEGSGDIATCKIFMKQATCALVYLHNKAFFIVARSEYPRRE
jgi:hypothetical protein